MKHEIILIKSEIFMIIYKARLFNYYLKSAFKEKDIFFLLFLSISLSGFYNYKVLSLLCVFFLLRYNQ